MDTARLKELAGIHLLNERVTTARTVFIPVSDMGAYEKWDSKHGQYQVYDDNGIHVHGDTETYFRQHVNKFEQAMGR